MLNVRLGRIPCLGEFTRTDGLIYVRVLHKWKISTKSPINAHRLHERITRGLKKNRDRKTPCSRSNAASDTYGLSSSSAIAQREPAH